MNVWVRRCTSFAEDAAADREFWRSVSPERRVAAVEELRAEWRRMKGEPDVLGSPFRADDGVAETVAVANVVVDPLGTFQVQWQKIGEAGEDLGRWGQGFTSSGAPLGVESLIVPGTGE